jgi:hypothetical protein
MDLDTGERKLLVSYYDLAMRAGKDTLEARHWVNVLTYSPSGSRIAFLHRWSFPGSGWSTRNYTMAADGSDVRLFAKGAAGHFAWYDEEHIGGDSGGNYKMFSVFSNDEALILAEGGGHLTFLGGGNWMLADTYPRDNRIQRPFLFHIPTDEIFVLGHFPSPPEYKGSLRVDTHPRLGPDQTKVVIDSAHEGLGRQLYLIDVAPVVKRDPPSVCDCQ